VRTSSNGKHSTLRFHLPARIKARFGPNVATFVEVVMRDRKHPEQGYRTCLG